MAEASILQSVGGTLGGQRWEFRGGDVLVGSGPDCAVRIDASGVEARHARIVIDAPGATIYRLDGLVGVNDDLVTTAGLLRSGDFVWIGEPGGASSIMLQFTLGAVEETAAASPSKLDLIETPREMAVEGDGAPDLVPPGAGPEGGPVAEPPQSQEPDEVQPVSSEAPMMEASPVASEGEEAQPEPEQPERSALGPLPVTPASAESFALEITTAEIPKKRPTEIEPPAEVKPALAEVEPALAEVEPALGEVEPALPEVEPALPEVEPALAEVEPALAEVEPEPQSQEETPAPNFPTLLPPPIVPLAPWQMPSASATEPAAPAEYASAWESAPVAPVAPAPAPPEDADATVLLPKATAPVSPAAPPPARPAPVPPPSVTRRPIPAAPRMAPRTVEQDAALRTPPPPPPPARTTASTPLVVGGLATLLVVGGVGLFLLRPASTPTAPPTPAPTATVINTPPAATPEPTQIPVVEPTLVPPPPVSTPVAPKPGATATPLPRATPSPRIAPTPRVTPTPRATPTPLPTPTARPLAPTATVAPPPPAVPVAPVSQVPRLIEEAQAAVIARDFPRASQLLDEALKLEPGNAAATARKTEVEARRASLARKFSYGATSVIGGKAAKGPTGFDLGGGGAVQTDLAAQIRCTTTPTSVEVGMRHSERCSILNIGTKAFRIESVVVNEALDGAKSAGAGVAPRTDIAPQSDAVILERVGVWNARTQWSIELVVKTTKGESFRAAYSWR